MSDAKCLVCLLSLKRLLEVECEIPYEKFQQNKFIQKKAGGGQLLLLPCLCEQLGQLC